MSWPHDEDQTQQDGTAEVQLMERERSIEQGWQQAEELFRPRLDQQEIIRLERSDRLLWRAVNHAGDVLGGMRFEDAVTNDPLRIEALIHQRIHNEFFDAMGLGGAQRQAAAAMGIDLTPFGQLQAFLDRNTAYRQLHGHLTAQLIADSLHRNWEQFSSLLTRMLLQAGANHPVGQAMLNFYVANWDRLSRAFREAQEIAHRAARVSERLGRPDDITAWRSVAAAIRDMADFVDRAIHAPRRPAGHGLAPMGRVGPRYDRPRRRPVPERRRLPAPPPPAVQGPTAPTVASWSSHPATVVQDVDEDGDTLIWSYLGRKGTTEAIVTIANDAPPRIETVDMTWPGKDRGEQMAALVRCRLRWLLSETTEGEWSDRISGLLLCDRDFGSGLIEGILR